MVLVSSLGYSELYWKQVAKGYDDPVDFVELPSFNGDQTFLVVEQGGKVILTDLKQDVEVFDWKKKVTRKANEQGLLSLALSPDYKKSGRIYLNLTNRKGDTEIWRVVLDPKAPYKGIQSEEMDPKNAAQSLQSLLGKLLRIDVSGESKYKVPSDNPFIDWKATHPEIYAYGLRNPWRCYWDGDKLYLADVGQNHSEEVNLVSRKQLKGANFGWRLREGNVPTPKKKVGGDSPKNAVSPILTYPHDNAKDPAGFSITGGVVYDGTIQQFKGRYIFADYVLTRIWSFKASGNQAKDFKSHTEEVLPDRGEIATITAFSCDLKGEVYLTCRNGQVFKLSEK